MSHRADEPIATPVFRVRRLALFCVFVRLLVGKGGENQMARPTKMTPDIVQKLEWAFLHDLNDTEACLYAGISRQTLNTFEKKNPAFLDKKILLRENVKMHARLNLSEKILDEKDVALSIWYLERKCADEFSKKGALELSGDHRLEIILPQEGKAFGE